MRVKEQLNYSCTPPTFTHARFFCGTRQHLLQVFHSNGGWLRGLGDYIMIKPVCYRLFLWVLNLRLLLHRSCNLEHFTLFSLIRLGDCCRSTGSYLAKSLLLKSWAIAFCGRWCFYWDYCCSSGGLRNLQMYGDLLDILASCFSLQRSCPATGDCTSMLLTRIGLLKLV